MSGRLIGIVPLILLIAFFGIQQHGRKKLYYRLWFVGWVVVFFSYVVWQLQPATPVWWQVVTAARFDLVLLAALTFLVSFLRPSRRLKKLLLRGLLVGVPAVLLMDAQEFQPVPKLLLVLGIAAWHSYGIYIARRVLGREGRWQSWLIMGLATLGAVMMLREVWVKAIPDMNDWELAEIYLCTAVLYARHRGRAGLANFIGVLGFVAWAGFYLAGMYLQHHSWSALHLLYQYWDFPKYFVAFSMILKISEDAQEKGSRLAGRYQAMYEDFRLMFDHNPHPALIYAEQTGRFLMANRAAVECYGYPESEFLARRIEDFEMEHDDESRIVEALLPPMTDGVRSRVRHYDGRPVWVSITGHSIRYKDTNARLVIVRDVAQKVKLDLEMVQRANHDALTGLPNRRLLEDRLERALERSIRDDKKTAVLTIDIDHFKRVNDTYGHAVGDECLKIAADRLSSKIRNVDTLARVGGEEFVAVVSGLGSVADAERIARDLLQAFEAPMQINGLDLPVTVSIGVAVFPIDGYDAEVLKLRSDEALYAAKRTGRNRYVTAGALLALGNGRTPGGNELTLPQPGVSQDTTW
jgi:diguanylate cyclase (GGDEF)-like protein/PAS domain S-box-containing protein